MCLPVPRGVPVVTIIENSKSLYLNPSRCSGVYLMLKQMEKEAKKEAFRKYLESSGVLDALTKVLVALYEENDKPSSAIEFVQNKLGGPSLSGYEKLQAEKSDLQIKYDELLAAHQEACRELEELRSSKAMETADTETCINKEMSKDKDL